MATLKELAQSTGYSPATISRILSGDPSLSVSDEARQRVLEEAGRLNYAATKSRRGRAPKSLLRIGLAERLTPQQQLDDPYFLYLGGLVRRHCLEQRYVCLPIPALGDSYLPPEGEGLDGIVAVVSDVLGVSAASLAGSGTLRTIEGTSAYVKISEGCDRFCTFCAIPYIRGRYHSRPASEIVSEVASLMEGGVREVVLIGQDTGVWGCDLGWKDTLATLLRDVAAAVRPYDGWVRVLYLQPEGMTDELIATIRDTPEVLPYIDIPIQHCSERVLRNMGRSGSPEELRKLFARLRDEIPGMVLRTTGMAGFPGETDEEADELYDFIADQGFDYCSVFAYSQEEGTRAAAMPDQIDEDVKLERTQRLIDLTEQLGFAATAAHVGERVRVIVDGVEEGEDGVELIGHAWFQAPDSDGAVHIASGEATVGDIVTVDLVDSFCYELVGELVGEGE